MIRIWTVVSIDLGNSINEFKIRMSLKSPLGMIGLALLIMILTCCNINNQSGVDASFSGIAPDFKLELFSNANHITGTNLHLSDLRGKPVVINFWYPSCPPCRLEMPDFEASYKLHKDDVEFIGVMSVHLDTVAEGQEFIDQFGITYAVGPDLDDITSEYEIIGFPTTIFLDQDHRVTRQWTGTLNTNKLERLIEEILPVKNP